MNDLQEAHADSPSDMLDAMAGAERFNRWMADVLAPYMAGDVIELGAGIGNLTILLSEQSRHYVAADIDEKYLARLEARTANRPHIVTARCDLSRPRDLDRFRARMDTVICLNVLEHVENDAGALHNMYSCLRNGGRALILVPQGMRAFGTLDKILNHHRRYSKPELEQKMRAAGFRIERILKFNRITYPAWFLNGRILRTKTLNRAQLRIFDRLVPLWRRIDRFLPWPPTSIIGIGVRDN